MWVITLVVTGIVWLVWQHRSHANLRAVRLLELTYTPAWAVAWWFIPLANFVMPFQTMRELWRASGREREWWRTKTWPVLGWWWAAWIVAAVIGRIAAASLNGARSIDGIIAANLWFVTTVLVEIVAAVLAIVMVRSIVDRQEGLAMIGAYGEVPPCAAVPAPARATARSLDSARWPSRSTSSTSRAWPGSP